MRVYAPKIILIPSVSNIPKKKYTEICTNTILSHTFVPRVS